MIIRLIKKIVRQWLLRKRFPQSVIYSGVVVDTQSKISIHSVLFQNVVLLESSLGTYSYIQANTIVCNTQIGPFCSIAGNVHIGLAAHPTYHVSTSPVFYDNTQPLPHFFAKSKQFHETVPMTIIDADVWIGQSAMIKAGVKIGVGAIIGAGAMVTKDVTPYSVVVGVPAREIKKRFDDLTCQQLLDSKWWELDTEKLEELSPFFADPQLFLQALKKVNRQ